jgi:hypothetical protein
MRVGTAIAPPLREPRALSMRRMPGSVVTTGSIVTLAPSGTSTGTEVVASRSSKSDAGQLSRLAASATASR